MKMKVCMKLYGYKKCSTCRDAIKFLEASGIEYEWISIRETPPTAETLEHVLNITDYPLRRLFNSSGREYRFLNLKDKLHRMSDAQKIDLLAGNGNLVKRPLLVGDDVALVGFKEDEWKAGLKG